MSAMATTAHLERPEVRRGLHDRMMYLRGVDRHRRVQAVSKAHRQIGIAQATGVGHGEMDKMIADVAEEGPVADRRNTGVEGGKMTEDHREMMFRLHLLHRQVVGSVGMKTGQVLLMRRRGDAAEGDGNSQ